MQFGLGVRVMVFNTTFNNISVIMWQSVLLVEETGVSRENQIQFDGLWLENYCSKWFEIEI